MTIYDTAYWKAAWPTAVLAMETQSPEHIAQERALLEVLEHLQFKTVFEVGCGFGRVTRAVFRRFFPSSEAIFAGADLKAHPHTYVTTDASSDAIDRAMEHVGPAPGVTFTTFDLDGDGNTIEVYDLAITAELLMHRTPAEIERDCGTLAGLASKYVVNVDWYEPGFDGPSPGCYQHDYAALFGKYGTVERIDVPEARQAIWVTTLYATGGIVDLEQLARVGE